MLSVLSLVRIYLPPSPLPSLSRASADFISEQQWDLQRAAQSFSWVEQRIVFRPQPGAWQAALRDGMLEAGLGPYAGPTYEHVTGVKVGGGRGQGARLADEALKLAEGHAGTCCLLVLLLGAASWCCFLVLLSPRRTPLLLPAHAHALLRAHAIN